MVLCLSSDGPWAAKQVEPQQPAAEKNLDLDLESDERDHQTSHVRFLRLQ
eukprot:COSAG01_NODE_59561_length_299_cov_1.620000_1_plen_49_part_01